MDAALLHNYRLIWTDVTMLWDVASIYYSRRPIGGYNLTDFAAGLSALIKKENDYDESESHGDVDDVIDFTAEDTTAIRQLMWQFTHGVVLEFIAEELSQYPFWAAKVTTVVTNKGKSLTDTILSVISFYQDKLSRGGIRAVFEGNVPYLAASAIIHHQHLRKSVRFFLGLLRSHMPRHASGNLSNNQPRKNSMVNKKKKKRKKSMGMGIISRLATAVLIHPLLLISVRMLTCPQLAQQNWLSAYLSLITSDGISSLYTGLRISLLCALVPLAPWYTLGIPETVLYRRMSGQGKDDSLGGSISVLYNAVADEGSMGLLNFGLLTMFQMGAGFATFVATRSLLWLVCGTTMQRERLYKHRKEILEDLWPKHPKLPFFPTDGEC